MTLEERIKEMKVRYLQMFGGDGKGGLHLPFHRIFEAASPNLSKVMLGFNEYHLAMLLDDALLQINQLQSELQQEVDKYKHLWETNAQESKEIIAELKAENEKLKEWYPIETCPSDTQVLLYCPHLTDGNEERIELDVFSDTVCGSSHSWATKWKPLPSLEQLNKGENK